MTKRDKEAQLRRVIDMAQTSRLAIQSTIAMLTHLESEATSALLEMGSTARQTRKGRIKQIQDNFTPEDKYFIRYGKKCQKIFI